MGERGLVLFAVAALGCGPPEFLCAQDDECDGAAGGQCVQGYCAFPDDRCPSGLRFADHSGGLSGKCVDDEGGTGSSTDPGSGSTSGPTGSSNPGESGPPVTSTPPPDTSGEDASTGLPEGTVEFRDDELDDEFGAGTFSGTAYASARLQLAPGATEGTFVSRVFDAGAPVHWQTLTWAPDAPYGKPLPDGAAAEAGYASGGVDMRDNVLLYHFDDAGDLPENSVVSDASGRMNDGFIVGQNMQPSAGVPGVFGNAIEDSLGSYVSIPPGADDLSFGTVDFTWAIWFRFSHACTTNNVFIGVEDVVGGGDPYPHLWLGCTVGDWTPCGDGNDIPRPAGVLRSEHNAMNEGIEFCGPGPINDGIWHHIAIVKIGAMASEVRLFVDGVLVSKTEGVFISPFDLTQDGDFAFGGFSGATYPTQGTFDEAAIWRRALDDDEVRATYLRGALQLQVEVRVCQQADCADDPPFVGGSSLEAGMAFTDPADALGPGTEISIEGLPEGRWAQYRLTLTGSADAGTPAIAAVAMRGTY